MKLRQVTAVGEQWDAVESRLSYKGEDNCCKVETEKLDSSPDYYSDGL